MSQFHNVKDGKEKHSVSILDCTLRDGGYYNNWDFSKDLSRFIIMELSNLVFNRLSWVWCLQAILLWDPFTADDYLETLPLTDSVGWE